ncbi:SAM-dependent methyltransferase [Streptomyces aurantiacus]|uniref:SAM-dependent methyltransferase n=1 Tax=Streptomyces aurantiacus TaxID=47760 RepID=UPI000B2FCDFA|nr:SAM-dependent methyltransferase [Streptomyces aurantiacus]
MKDGDPAQHLTEIDTSMPHSARIWNYWVGGKDNYEVDRTAGDQVREVFPGIVDDARHTRAFLARAVRCLAGEEGVRQFLDIGTGLPTADNTHEIAQRVAPESRIVYVDNDPLVLRHAQALLTSHPEGACAYIDADVRDSDRILTGAARTLDFSRPIGLMMLGILGNVPDYDEALETLKRLLDALPSGSFLVVNDGTTTNVERNEAVRQYNENSGGSHPYTNRSPEQIGAYFSGLTLVEPGVVPTSQWRPEPNPWHTTDVAVLCGVGRKI